MMVQLKMELGDVTDASGLEQMEQEELEALLYSQLHYSQENTLTLPNISNSTLTDPTYDEQLEV